DGRGVWLEKAPFGLAAVVFGLAGFAAQGQPNLLRPLRAYGLLERAAQACYGLAFYLRQTLLPFRLSPLYERPARLEVFSAPFVLSALAVAAITAAAVWARRRRPAGLAVWGFYAITVAPMLGFVSFGTQLVACRYSYLSCLGWP